MGGFCPQHEELFASSKRDLGKCPKVHSIALKAEYEASPDFKRYSAEYDRKLQRWLESLVRSADDWGNRERRNILSTNIALETTGPNEVAKVEIQNLMNQANAYYKEAEDLAETNQVEMSKMKV